MEQPAPAEQQSDQWGPPSRLFPSCHLTHWSLKPFKWAFKPQVRLKLYEFSGGGLVGSLPLSSDLSGTETQPSLSIGLVNDFCLPHIKSQMNSSESLTSRGGWVGSLLMSSDSLKQSWIKLFYCRNSNVKSDECQWKSYQCNGGGWLNQ